MSDINCPCAPVMEYQRFADMANYMKWQLFWKAAEYGDFANEISACGDQAQQLQFALEKIVAKAAVARLEVRS